MSGYIDKIIIIILVGAMLLFVPIVTTAHIKDMQMYRTMLNEADNFVDLIIDKGDYSDSDLSDLYLTTAEFGVPMHVEVLHYQRILNPVNEQGRVTVGYRIVPLEGYRWEEGDKVQITIELLELTRGQKYKRDILKYEGNPYKVTAAGRLRRARDISAGG